ncbi:MAG: PEP-utilizing enzyme [Candidatus Woesearchaeota archaeon]
MDKLEFGGIERLVSELMAKEDRKDEVFRHVIAVSEVGDIGKYITHDPELNPNARPHGTKEDEVLAYGQAFVQLAALAYLRNISLENAFSKGLQNWIDADWRKRKAVEDKDANVIKGLPASPGYVSGMAEVALGKPSESYEGKILVVPYATPDYTEYLSKSLAFVSDHGGLTCHLANIAREKGVPCVVGTGNATERIKSGDAIAVDGAEGKVYILA